MVTTAGGDELGGLRTPQRTLSWCIAATALQACESFTTSRHQGLLVFPAWGAVCCVTACSVVGHLPPVGPALSPVAVIPLVATDPKILLTLHHFYSSTAQTLTARGDTGAVNVDLNSKIHKIHAKRDLRGYCTNSYVVIL